VVPRRAKKREGMNKKSETKKNESLKRRWGGEVERMID
jgi:hypothetical protein